MSARGFLFQSNHHKDTLNFRYISWSKLRTRSERLKPENILFDLKDIQRNIWQKFVW